MLSNRAVSRQLDAVKLHWRKFGESCIYIQPSAYAVKGFDTSLNMLHVIILQEIDILHLDNICKQRTPPSWIWYLVNIA